MLAYVFWHWPHAGVEKAAYEERLGRFHSRLASHPPEGYVSSAAFPYFENKLDSGRDRVRGLVPGDGF